MTDVTHNAFLDGLKDDEFVAINPAGTPIGRASSRAALEQAHGADAEILSAADVKAAAPTLAEAATSKLDGPFAAVVAQGGPTAKPELPPDADKKAPVKAAPLDHDEDGKKGGNVLNKDKVAADKKSKLGKNA
jgi:hypothetical protein